MAGLEARSAQTHDSFDRRTPWRRRRISRQRRTSRAAASWASSAHTFLTLESEDTTMSSDNITLVRAAKPAKKDLPAGKDVKGGKKREA